MIHVSHNIHWYMESPVISPSLLTTSNPEHCTPWNTPQYRKKCSQFPLYCTMKSQTTIENCQSRSFLEELIDCQYLVVRFWDNVQYGSTLLFMQRQNQCYRCHQRTNGSTMSPKGATKKKKISLNSGIIEFNWVFVIELGKTSFLPLWMILNASLQVYQQLKLIRMQD